MRPVYWMHETSGEMKQIVMKFIRNAPLSGRELEAMREYVFQWIRHMPSKPKDFAKVMTMSYPELRSYLAGELLDYGIDPL